MKLIEHNGWWSIDGRECQITIERRPPYCDRGRFIAKVFPRGRFALEFDAQDGWPRYYFDWDRMLAEIEAWLQVRGFFCPRCGAHSFNPNDVAEGYCARCHDWTGDPRSDA